MTNGYVSNKAYLGITPNTMTEQMAAQYRYDVTKGVFICSVEEGSAADKAGLKMGDVIMKVDGTDVDSYQDLVALKKKYSAGDESTFTIYRDGQQQERLPHRARGSHGCADRRDQRGDGRQHKLQLQLGPQDLPWPDRQ